jgi:hypothetical protein
VRQHVGASRDHEPTSRPPAGSSGDIVDGDGDEDEIE